MSELDEQSAKDLNALCEYTVQFERPFGVPYYTEDVLGKPELENYYLSLLRLAERIMKNHDAVWLYTDGKTVSRNTSTKSFLEQGGFLKLLRKQQPRWADEHPILDKFRTGAITALFSLTVGTILWLLANQKQVQAHTQLLKQLDSLSQKVDSLSKQKKK